MEGDSTCVGNVSRFIRRIEIAAAIFADLNDGVVELTRNLYHQVIHAGRPYLQSRFRQRTLGRHLHVDLRQGIAARCAAFSLSFSAEMACRA